MYPTYVLAHIAQASAKDMFLSQWSRAKLMSAVHVWLKSPNIRLAQRCYWAQTEWAKEGGRALP
jgi:hypothetical protein